MMLLRSSGSSRDASTVEPTRSQNITVSCRRSAEEMASRIVGWFWEDAEGIEVGSPRGINFVPHSPQNLAVARLVLPQVGQLIGNRPPHSRQNFALGGFS